MYKNIETTAHYMLRRNLPIWRPAETIAETLAYCEESQIAEVIWKVDCEDFNHGFTPLSLTREFLPWLEQAREDSKGKGILFSINPWVTLNHIGRCRYVDGPPIGFHWRVDHAGEEAKELACPLSVGWREWFLEAYRLFSTTKPDKLWLEDDFKTFPLRAWDLGCYCEAHLGAFSEQIGQETTRKDLVQRILSPGDPDPIRSEWFDFQGRIMVELCREVEKVVHAESPGTRLGLMCSWSTDCRWWNDAVLALAGSLRPLARPHLGCYQDRPAAELFPDQMRKEVSCLSSQTENSPELENWPFTPYSKSVRMTRLQLIMSQVLGNRSVTMNLFDFVGSPIAGDSRTSKLLGEVRPLLDAIASIAGPGGRPRGVSIPFSKRYGDSIHTEPGQGFKAFFHDGDKWTVPLQASGIPIVFNGSGHITAAAGQSLRAFSRKDIEQFLGKGLLIDGSAAAVLHELGFGPQIGVEPGQSFERFERLLSAERDDWQGAEPADNPTYMSLTAVNKPILHGKAFELNLAESARTVSSIVDPDGEVVMPGMTLFENQWGGRVAVYPFDLSEGVDHGFMNWHRRRQLQRVVGWLGRDNIDLFVDGGAWMMPVRRDYSDYTLIAVLNFESDPWNEVSLKFDCPEGQGPHGFELLESSGEFEKIEPSSLNFEHDNVLAKFCHNVMPLDCFIARVLWKGQSS